MPTTGPFNRGGTLEVFTADVHPSPAKVCFKVLTDLSNIPDNNGGKDSVTIHPVPGILGGFFSIPLPRWNMDAGVIFQSGSSRRTTTGSGSVQDTQRLNADILQPFSHFLNILGLVIPSEPGFNSNRQFVTFTTASVRRIIRSISFKTPAPAALTTF